MVKQYNASLVSMGEYSVEQMLPMELSINKKEKIDEIENFYNLSESKYLEVIEVIIKYLEKRLYLKKKLENKKKGRGR